VRGRPTGPLSLSPWSAPVCSGKVPVLPNDRGASCEDTFPVPKTFANLFRAYFELISNAGMDAAAKTVVFFARL